jgi:uncharacterized membrane protein
VSRNTFITAEERDQIVKAIESAELNTSGEIRVHIESYCKKDPVGRAILIFNKLRMYETRERNGVLIYIAFKSRKLSVIGDSGINSMVPENFWNEVKEILASHLAKGELSAGLVKAISLSGEKLKAYFPYKNDDINEQSNEISFGK